MKSLFKRIQHPFIAATVKARRIPAFSLVEVVVAVGIFAIGIVGVLGLLSPSIKSVSEVGDTAVANRLADNIQVELERLGFTAVTTALPNSGALITLVANRDGSRVLLSTVADNDVAATDRPPGILHRDRYYGITVQQLSSLPYVAANSPGFIALSVRVVWPYQIPVGPAGATTSPAAETSTTYTPVAPATGSVPVSQQSVMLLNMAIRP